MLIITGAGGYIAAVSNTTGEEGNGTALYLLDATSSTPLLNTSLSGRYLSHHCSHGSQCAGIHTRDDSLTVQVALEDGIWIVDIRTDQFARLSLNSTQTINTSCATLNIGNTVIQESVLVLCTNADRLLAYNAHLDAPYIQNSPVTELTTLPPDYESALSNIIESQNGSLHFFLGGLLSSEQFHDIHGNSTSGCPILFSTISCQLH